MSTEMFCRFIREVDLSVCVFEDVFMYGNVEFVYLFNVVGGYEYKMDGLSSNLRRRPLQVAVAGLLSELGYEQAEKMAYETLIEMVQSSKFVLICNFIYVIF
jgi:hypothetical protein